MKSVINGIIIAGINMMMWQCHCRTHDWLDKVCLLAAGRQQQVWFFAVFCAFTSTSS